MGTVDNVLNFGAGPAKLPREVLLQVQNELLSFEHNGMSIMEMSHRSKEYLKINNDAQTSIRELLKVPENYKILFIQGGATGAFAAVVMNLIGRTGTADYCVTGTWSQKAYKEAQKYGDIKLAFPIANKPGSIPKYNTWVLNPNASYLYYCANETVDGVEFSYIPETNGVPLVTDMSSNIMTKEFDVSKFGLIFAGAQKNIGPAGVVVIIIRDDLLAECSSSCIKQCPSIFDFRHISKENSIHNTPATFSVYVMNKVFDWIRKEGGVSEMERRSIAKSHLLYETMQHCASGNYYCCPIDVDCQSRMNVPFRVGGPNGNEQLEEKFLKEAEAKFMQQLKGHRSVGGVRASLYNAVTLEDVNSLVDFMLTFQENNRL